MAAEFWLYAAPFLRCRQCHQDIPLPYEQLPETDQDLECLSEETDLLDLPDDEWTVVFGCHACGCVELYEGRHVFEKAVQKRARARYQSDANCFCARFPCGRKDCKSPTTMHANILDGGENEFLARLRNGFFHGMLPCGHELQTVPQPFYKIDRAVEQLW